MVLTVLPRWRRGFIPGVLVLSSLVCVHPAVGAERLSAPALIELAGKSPNSADFRESLVLSLGEQRIKNGTAVMGQGPDFIWAIEAPSAPQLVLDDQAPVALK